MSKRLSCPIGFNAQHSPMGAFMSFTCGNPGTKGGIGLQIGQPADQEVFIGVIDGDRYADAPLQSLPFYIGAVSKAAEAFTVEQAGPSEANVRPDAVPFKLEEVERRYGWCTDSWQAGALTFTVYTPFASIPDPKKASARKMRDGLRPAVVAQLVVDNTKGKKPKTGIFALNHARTGPRMITDDLGTEDPRRLRLPPRGRRRGRGVRRHLVEEGRRAAAVRLHALVGDRRHPRALQPGAPAGVVPGRRLRGAARQALRDGAGHRLLPRSPGDHGTRGALPLHPLLRRPDGRAALDARQGRRADGRRRGTRREARQGRRCPTTSAS